MSIIIKILLPFLVLPLVSGEALCDGPEGLRSEFFYTTFVDSIPYLIFDNAQKLYGIQSALLNRDPHNYKLELILESYDIYKADVAGLFKGLKAFEITGDAHSYDNLIRLRRGDIMAIEKTSVNGDGPRIGVAIEKVMFLSNGWASSIVIRCGKIKEDEHGLLTAREWTDHLIAYYNDGREVKEGEQRAAEKVKIPAAVQKVISESAEDYLPSEDPDEYPYPHVTASPIRSDMGEIFYAAVLSYGEKEVHGKLLLLNEEGDIIQDTGEKSYNRIIGLISPSKRKSQALVTFYGSGYGGGIELFSFDRRRPVLVSRLKVNTVID